MYFIVRLPTLFTTAIRRIQYSHTYRQRRCYADRGTVSRLCALAGTTQESKSCLFSSVELFLFIEVIFYFAAYIRSSLYAMLLLPIHSPVLRYTPTYRYTPFFTCSITFSLSLMLNIIRCRRRTYILLALRLELVRAYQTADD